MGKILQFIGWLVETFFSRKPAKRSADERAGRAEARLETKEASDAAVQDAVAARNDADARVVRDPESVRQPDRYSRD